jgi:SH3-like domain-containing protein
MGRGWWVRAVAGIAAALVMSVYGETTVCAAGGAEAQLPRFAVLHADKVNLRAGPGDRYPIEWVYLRKDWPVEVIAQFDHWRRVRDWEGTEGWVHEKMVTNRREVIVTGGVRVMRQSPDHNGGPIARAEPGVMAKLVECRGEWCRIEAGDTAGWVQRSDIWGVYPNESVP